MKIKLMGLLAAAVLFAGCGKTVAVKDAPINPQAKNYAEALQSAATSCKVDADCTSVKKGCCLCNGYAPVNKEGKKNARWPLAPCKCAMWKLTLPAKTACAWAPPSRWKIMSLTKENRRI